MTDRGKVRKLFDVKGRSNLNPSKTLIETGYRQR